PTHHMHSPSRGCPSTRQAASRGSNSASCRRAPDSLLDLLCTIVPLTIVPQYSILEPRWMCTLPSSVGAFTCELYGRRFQFARQPVVGDEEQSNDFGAGYQRISTRSTWHPQGARRPGSRNHGTRLVAPG